MRTVVRVRQAFLYRGLAGAIHHKKPTGPRPRKMEGELEAHLVAVVCSPPPVGRVRWTVRLLSDELVQVVEAIGRHPQESVSRETIRKTLKKMRLSPG